MLKMTIDDGEVEETMRELRKSIDEQRDAIVNVMGDAREQLNAAVIESNLQASVEEIETIWKMACEKGASVWRRCHDDN